MSSRVIQVRWSASRDKVAVHTSEDDERSWQNFGDPLSKFSDGFEFHDCYHWLFMEVMAWSPVLSRFFFQSDPDPTAPNRALLMEESLIMNEFNDGKTDLNWCMKSIGQVGVDCTREQMAEVMAAGRRELRRLISDFNRLGVAYAIYEVEHIERNYRMHRTRF